jgi:hypothetical protein
MGADQLTLADSRPTEAEAMQAKMLGVTHDKAARTFFPLSTVRAGVGEPWDYPRFDARASRCGVG